MNARGGRRSSRAATRRDDDALLEFRQRRERAQPLRDDVRVRRERIVGQGLAIRERPDTVRPRGEKAQFREVLVRLAAAARDDDERGRRGRRLREEVRGAAAIQLAPAEAFACRGQSDRGGTRLSHEASCRQNSPFRANPAGSGAQDTCAGRPARSAGGRAPHEDRVQHAVILEIHGELRVVPARDRRIRRPWHAGWSARRNGPGPSPSCCPGSADRRRRPDFRSPC